MDCLPRRMCFKFHLQVPFAAVLVRSDLVHSSKAHRCIQAIVRCNRSQGAVIRRQLPYLVWSMFLLAAEGSGRLDLLLSASSEPLKKD